MFTFDHSKGGVIEIQWRGGGGGEGRKYYIKNEVTKMAVVDWMGGGGEEGQTGT